MVPFVHVYVVLTTGISNAEHATVIGFGNTAAVAVPYVPAAQSAHTVESAAEVYVAAAHTVQTVAPPDAYWPAAQLIEQTIPTLESIATRSNKSTVLLILFAPDEHTERTAASLAKPKKALY